MYLEKEEMKFAVLYTIKQYKAPLSMSRIFEILTWDKQVMEYFELSEALMELLEDEYIYEKFYRGEEAYCLTETGDHACIYFKGRIPRSIRDRIDDSIGKIRYDEVADPNAIRAEVVLAAEEQYAARCTVCDEKVPMLELTLNMGSKLQAETVAEYFRENAQSIYGEILKLCVPELAEKEKKDETKSEVRKEVL